jgi:acetolactate synthase-1/2/3 large subunit
LKRDDFARTISDRRPDCSGKTKTNRSTGESQVRKVIAFQADGSGLYDCQALWTMARYNLNVCVVICNNSSYNILNIENAMQRVEDANKTNVSKSLTSLGEPTIDWVTMAKSFGFRMATRCDTIESFQMVFQEAMEKNGDGPILVEAVL